MMKKNNYEEFQEVFFSYKLFKKSIFNQSNQKYNSIIYFTKSSRNIYENK